MFNLLSDDIRFVMSPEVCCQKNLVSRVKMRDMKAIWKFICTISFTRSTSLFLITSISALPTVTPQNKAAIGYRSASIPLGITLLNICLLMKGRNMPKRLTVKAARSSDENADMGVTATTNLSISFALRAFGGKHG